MKKKDWMKSGLMFDKEFVQSKHRDEMERGVGLEGFDEYSLYKSHVSNVHDTVNKIKESLDLSDVMINEGRFRTDVKGVSRITGENVSISIQRKNASLSNKSTDDIVKRLYEEYSSQQEIADYLGISQKTVSNTINNIRKLTSSPEQIHTFFDKTSRLDAEALLSSMGKSCSKKNINMLYRILEIYPVDRIFTKSEIRDFLVKEGYDDFFTQGKK